jgi:hypothetical protein
MTKEDLIHKAVESLTEVPSKTKTKAWFFNFNGKIYHVAHYWVIPIGDHIGVYPAVGKGKRDRTKNALVNIPNCKDPVKGITKLVDLLYNE